jgi:hypothetical protein
VASRKEQKEQARAQRLEQERQAAANAARKRRYWLLGGGLAAAVVIAVVLIVVSTGGGGNANANGSNASPGMGFEGVPLEGGPQLASAGTTQTGPVDGISCGASEQLVYHIHVHLAVFVNGQQRSLPGGVGIPGSTIANSAQGPVAQGGTCIYWLHTHTSDGVIHVESPIQRVYTLGNFFDEWHQPLSASQVAGAKGTVTAFVNGKPWTGNLRDIPFHPHTVIQISVGRPVMAFKSVSWSGTQL